MVDGSMIYGPRSDKKWFFVTFTTEPHSFIKVIRKCHYSRFRLAPFRIAKHEHGFKVEVFEDIRHCVEIWLAAQIYIETYWKFLP